jgi:uncharacterized protein (TIGR02246 family)
MCLLGLTACVRATAPVAEADTRAVDEKALRDTEAASAALWSAKDANKVADLYAEDATIAIPNLPLIKGKEVMRETLKAAFLDPNFKLEFHSTGVEVAKSGDLGYVTGAYVAKQTDLTRKKAVVEKGNYLMVYKKQADGSWKVIRDSATPEAPPAPAK